MNPKDVVSYIEGEPFISMVLDLLNIVLIGIANELPEHDDKYELHRLLSTLLSMELSVDEKLGIMEKEYNIAVDDRIRESLCWHNQSNLITNTVKQ